MRMDVTDLLWSEQCESTHIETQISVRENNHVKLEDTRTVRKNRNRKPALLLHRNHARAADRCAERTRAAPGLLLWICRQPAWRRH